MKAGKLALMGIASGLLLVNNSCNHKSIDEAVQIDPKIQQFMKNPSKTMAAESDDTYLCCGHEMIVLSNIAEGLTSHCIKNSNCDDYEDKLMNIVDLALSNQMSPCSESFRYVEQFDNQGLYLGHLNIILGAYKRATGEDTYEPINSVVSLYLADRTINDPFKHVPSYPSENGEEPFRWPADQAVILYSLHLFDKNFGTNISEEPIKQWLEFMDESGTDEETKLHKSEVSRDNSFSKQPRGCALSWSVRYMSHFAPQQANELWGNYKKHFKRDFMIAAGFREWKQGSEHEDIQDIDSGPIIMSMGISATAYAIGASKMMSDTTTFRQLKNAEKVGDIIIAVDKDIENISNGILAKSIQFNAANMRKWY